MNKAELAGRISKEMNLSKKQSENLVNYVFLTVIDELKNGNEVTITGFGTFSARYRSARAGVNPQSPNERIQIPATTVAKFKAGKRLKDALKNSTREI